MIFNPSPQMAKEVKALATELDLTVSDILRHSLKIGMPIFKRDFPRPQKWSITDEQLAAAYAQQDQEEIDFERRVTERLPRKIYDK